VSTVTGVQAHFDRGVLEIRIPRPETEKPRHVRINLGARPSREAEAIEGSKTADSQTNSHDPVPAATAITDPAW
jgi:hypothetical protein